VAHTGQIYHVTLWLWPLSLEFLGLTVRKIWHIFRVCVSRPVTLTFDLLTLKLVRNAARVMGYLLPILVILRLFVFDLWSIGPTTAKAQCSTCHGVPCNFDLWPYRSWRLWLMRVVVLHPCTKFEVRGPCHSEDMVHDVNQSINQSIRKGLEWPK